MTDFKPKNLDETLRDIIGSALNNNSTFYEDAMGRCSDNYVPAEDFDKVEDEILDNIKESPYLNVKFRDKKEILRLLLEGKNGFYRKYYIATTEGSIDDMVKVINGTLDEIFKIFKDNKNE